MANQHSNPTDLDSSTTELWNIVKRDSLASSRIGSPSGNTRAAIQTIIARECDKARIDELSHVGGHDIIVSRGNQVMKLSHRFRQLKAEAAQKGEQE